MLKFISQFRVFFIATFVFGADIITKFLTQAFIPLRGGYSLWYPYGGIPVFKNFMGVEFSIVHAINKGAAWGILANFQESLLVFRVLLIIGLVIFAIFLNKNKRWEIPLALIISGALGNVVDFFLYGHVIDMFYFVLWGYDFPVFNIADSAIFLGICSLFIISYLEGSKDKVKKASKNKS